MSERRRARNLGDRAGVLAIGALIGAAVGCGEAPRAKVFSTTPTEVGSYCAATDERKAMCDQPWRTDAGGRLELDPASPDARFTLVTENGRTLIGVWELQGDRLALSPNEAGVRVCGLLSQDRLTLLLEPDASEKSDTSCFVDVTCRSGCASFHR